MQKNQINSICTTIFNSCQRVIVKQETKHKRNGTITRCQKVLLQIKKNECVKGDLILCQNENPMVHENIYRVHALSFFFPKFLKKNYLIYYVL